MRVLLRPKGRGRVDIEAEMMGRLGVAWNIHEYLRDVKARRRDLMFVAGGLRSCVDGDVICAVGVEVSDKGVAT